MIEWSVRVIDRVSVDMSGRPNYRYYKQPNFAHAQAALAIMLEPRRHQPDAVIVSREVGEYVVYNATE